MMRSVRRRLGSTGARTLFPGVDQRSQGPVNTLAGVDGAAVLVPEVADGDGHLLGYDHAVVEFEGWLDLLAEEGCQAAAGGDERLGRDIRHC